MTALGWCSNRCSSRCQADVPNFQHHALMLMLMTAEPYRLSAPGAGPTYASTGIHLALILPRPLCYLRNPLMLAVLYLSGIPLRLRELTGHLSGALFLSRSPP